MVAGMVLGCGDGPQRLENRMRDYGGVACHHEHGHGLSYRPSDTEHYAGGNTGHRRGYHHLGNGLPFRGTQGQGSLPQSPGAVAHGILGHSHDGRQSHDSQDNTARQPALSHRQAEDLLQQGNDDYQAEEAVDDRRYAVEQLNDGLENVSHPLRSHLGHIDRYADAER